MSTAIEINTAMRTYVIISITLLVIDGRTHPSGILFSLVVEDQRVDEPTYNISKRSSDRLTRLNIPEDCIALTPQCQLLTRTRGNLVVN
jgi:hypothetical protein